jgi:deoxycytidine triphosphate deaminase
MILCDHHLEKAIQGGLLIVEPMPEPSQYDSSALNLRVGDDFRVWKKALAAR